MKTRLLSLLAGTLLPIIAGVQAQTLIRPEPAPWQTYTISGEDFSFAAPTLPAMHISYEFLERIQKSRRIYNLGSYADGVAYVIYVYENPEPRQSLESFLEERSVSKFTPTEVTLDRFRGKAISGLEGVSQFFATEDRLYIFQTFGAPPDDPKTTKFFSSLSLRRKKDSIAVTDGPGLPYEPAAESISPDDDATRKLFTGKEVDRKARLAMKPEPSYTESARQNQIAGTVVLKVIFSSNGSVTNIRTISGLPDGLTEKAIDAARKIKFIPAMKDGKYVSMWMQLEYNFNLY